MPPEPPHAPQTASAVTHKTVLRALRGTQLSASPQIPNGNSQRIPKTLAALVGPSHTRLAQPPEVRMTRQQTQALEVVRLAIDAARKTGLTDDQISNAINLPDYLHRVTVGTKPKR